MTTIQVTAQPEYAAQQLTITATETLTAITRSDANGVGEVRTLPGILPYTPTLAEVGRNYITNPSFELGTAAWTPTRSTASRYDFNSSSYWDGKAVGRYGLRLVSDAATGTSFVQSDAITITPGQWAAAQLRGSASTVRWAVGIMFYNGTTWLAESYAAVMPAASVYALTASTHSAQAPATATNYRVIYRLYGAAGEAVPPAASTGYLDAVMAVKAATQAAALAAVADPFDGDRAGDTRAYSWAGAAHASESIAKAPTADLVLTDYEAASGAVSYTAGNATRATSWAIPGPWLMVPTMPAYSVELETLLEYSAGGQSLGSVHELLGRNDPVAILRGMGTRRGTLRLYCGTFAQALTVAEATKRGEVLMLRQPEHEGMDMYFVATSYGIPTLDTNGGASVFGLDVSYVEVTRPVGALSGTLGWTFAALASSYPSFASLPGAYATFQDALLNEPK